MATTTEPHVFIPKSIKTHLEANLTDPLGTSRDSNKDFITVGPSIKNPQYPYININLAGMRSEDSAAGTLINPSNDKGKDLFPIIKIQIFADDKGDPLTIGAEGYSRHKLLYYFASRIMLNLTQLTGKASLDGTYDIQDVELDSEDEVIGPDTNGELILTQFYDVDFLWRY